MFEIEILQTIYFAIMAYAFFVIYSVPFIGVVSVAFVMYQLVTFYRAYSYSNKIQNDTEKTEAEVDMHVIKLNGKNTKDIGVEIAKVIQKEIEKNGKQKKGH